jgi:hypothetical protein
MVQYVYCKKCNKVIDEYETECFWCKKKEKEEKEKNE